MKTRLPLFAIVVGLLTSASVTQAQEEVAVPDSVTPERVLIGNDLFNGGSCVVCHAVAGRGSGRWAPDLSDVEWLHSDGDFNGIFDTIFWGVKEEEMAAKSPRRFEMHPKGGLAINREQVKALAAYVWTISHPATHPIVSTQVRFLELARAGRLDEALKLFEQALREHPGHLLLGEQAVNTLGYEFMPGRPLLARKIFELNVELHPESWNVYDSLAESYMVAGERERAIELYEESLELNPRNRTGLEMLQKLGAR